MAALALALNPSSAISTFLALVLLIAIVLHVALVLWEVLGSHSNSHVALAARYMRRGGLCEIFWGPFSFLAWYFL